MKLMRSFIVFSLLIFTYSCELLNDVEEITDELTESEIIQGLKTALEIGTDSSATALSVINGYYGNELLKILLPDEVANVRTNVTAIVDAVPGVRDLLDLDQQFENVILSINRAAEGAAKEASPIFKDAITSLTISDGLNILKGINPLDTLQKAGFDSTAATNYFRMVTVTALSQLYGGKIDIALDTDMGLGFSANGAWTTLRSNYNNAVSSITENTLLNAAVGYAGYELNEIETESIGVFCTEKALNGLFHLVGEEEKKIRKNPLEWALTAVGNILERVFTWFNENE